MEKLEINTEYIKLDQLLKFAGICDTGAQAKNMILEGIVKVNGSREMQRGKKIRNDDVVEVEGNKIIVCSSYNRR